MSAVETLNWYGWAVVQRETPYAEGPCWEWNGPKHVAGYGNIRITHPKGYPTFVRAHRVALEESGCSVPPELHVLHRCDNPPCVRPTHLRVGSDAENTRDKMQHGRYRNGGPMPGERNPAAIFTRGEVETFRALHTSGMRQRDILKRYPHLKQQTLSRILTRKTWTHV